MGKLKVFEVTFDGGVDVFRPGDWVHGHVRIVISEPKSDIRGIEIIFQGIAKTAWTETEGTGDNKHTVHYGLTEKYFEEQVLILGKDKKDKSGEKVSLHAGEHNLPFKFHIPAITLPHAFEGKYYGFIRYMVQVKIDRPWKFDHATQRLFNIVGVPVDLNTKPEAPMPSKSENEKTVCCLCCESGPIRASAQTNKSGYVPGETIWVSGFVENNSNRDICDVTATLYQQTQFRGHRSGRVRDYFRGEWTELGKQKGEGCSGHRTATADRMSILVPSCPPSGLEGCSIISIEYYVEFRAGVSGTPFNLRVNLPITIGTIPLSNAYCDVLTPGVVTQQPTASSSDPPPPSYENATGGLQEIPSESGHDFTFGKLMYAPKYPCYPFPAPGDVSYAPS